jgi:hypothetical protein
MLYGELGRYPLHITVYSRMIGFWNRIITGNNNKYSQRMYNFLLNNNSYHSKWISKIKEILNLTGKTHLWDNQNTITSRNIKHQIKQALIHKNKQSWNDEMTLSSKGRFYNTFKNKLELENYIKILPMSKYLPLYKLRTANHHFPIETGRWNGTVEIDRICLLCNENQIGNEEHYLLHCSHFTIDLIALNEITNTTNQIINVPYLLTLTDSSQLLKLSTFVIKLLKQIQR